MSPTQDQKYRDVDQRLLTVLHDLKALGHPALAMKVGAMRELVKNARERALRDEQFPKATAEGLTGEAP